MEGDEMERSQIEQELAEGNYAEVVEGCEWAIEQQPDQVSSYWYLGLAQLLQGQEEEAQITWMAPLMEADPDQVEQWVAELVAILAREAERQESHSAYETAWLVRQHIRTVMPGDLFNLLHTLNLALKAKVFSFDDEILAQTTAALTQAEFSDSSIDASIAINLLLQITDALLELDPAHPDAFAFVEACIPHVSDLQASQPFADLLLNRIIQLQKRSETEIAIVLGRLCVQLVPDNLKVLFNVASFLRRGDPACLLESIALAERGLALANRLGDRLMAYNHLLSSWMYSGGDWQKATEIYQDYKALLLKFLDRYPHYPGEPPNESAGQNHATDRSAEDFDIEFLAHLLAVGSHFYYFEDAPQVNRPIRNQIADIAESHLQSVLKTHSDRYSQRAKHTQPLVRSRLPKIGYLSGCLQQHSVGWLCRWLLQHHDRDRFEIHLYTSRQSDDLVQRSLIKDYGDRFHVVPSVIAQMADQIHNDEIDILVELDSLTSYGGCGVVALKPAPIQVNWLGFDASGIPAVDYFIADPYVLPDDAQTYYSEKIWRLPQTYIAVDGFEVHTPALRRDHLGIPADAVVFLSSQTGMKRNTDNARLQLQVIKAVPNSYFLIKSFKANPEFVEQFFRELAEEQGVSGDRLRFLPDVASECTHRANLALADVVLDTYPYNGATTTLEALWMGLPIVTRVGQQFAARNSYTMMMNTGITEGIAWNDEQYLEWGVRLGTDEHLRQNIFYRLQQSRHTSPLWNGQQFAREMEKAYIQMWERYLER